MSQRHSSVFNSHFIPVAILFAVLPITVRAADDAGAQLRALGAEVTETNGIITKIDLRDCSKIGAPEYQLIGQIKSLKSISLGKCHSLDDAAFTNLTGLENLEDLMLEGMMLTDEGMKRFRAFKNLRTLNCFHPSLNLKGYTGVGWANLKVLPKLERLTIAGSNMGDAGLQAVGEIPQLKEFRTWHTYQTHAGTEVLLRLTNLRSLWFGQRLRRYDGGSNALTLDDDTLGILARIPTLERLTLDEARLTHDGLLKLKELPALKEIRLMHIDIPASDIEKLRAEMPQVKIVWEQLSPVELEKLNSFLKPPGK